MSPVGLATLAVAAGVGGLIMAGKGIHNYFRERGLFGIKGTGGEAFTEAHNEAKEELEAVGVTVVGTDDDNLRFKIIGSSTGSRRDKEKDAERNGTKEQKEAIARYKQRRAELNKLRDEMDDEIKAQRATIKSSGSRKRNTRGGGSRTETYSTKEDTAQRDKLEQEVRAKYAAKLSDNEGGGGGVQPQTALIPAPGGGSGDLASAAESLRGMSSASGPDGGKNGCVWAVNQVYKKAGITPPWGSALYVPTAESDMINAGYTQVSSADRQPGDVMVMYDRKTPPQAHIGVVLKNGNVLSNSSGQASFSWESSPEGYNNYYGNTGKIYRMPNFASNSNGAKQNTPAPTQASIQSMPSQSTGTPGQMPKAQPNVVFRPNTQTQQSTPPSSGSGGGSKKPNISSSNPNNFYTMYSQIQYNVVR